MGLDMWLTRDLSHLEKMELYNETAKNFSEDMSDHEREWTLSLAVHKAADVAYWRKNYALDDWFRRLSGEQEFNGQPLRLDEDDLQAAFEVVEEDELEVVEEDELEVDEDCDYTNEDKEETIAQLTKALELAKQGESITYVNSW